MLQPFYHKDVIEVGCDEAGRGCLAGPVFAAAVVLPPDYESELLNDSKQLSEKRRYALREVIERDSLAWAVGIVKVTMFVVGFVGCAWASNKTAFGTRIAGKDSF